MDSLLTGLSDAQLQAVTADESLLCVLAGAGSGKTRVLTRRVAWLADAERIDPKHALVLTFTRKAANELSQRLTALGFADEVAAGTFHSVAYAQLRARWADRNVRAPRLIDRRIALFAKALPDVDPDTLRSALTELDWARARLIEPRDYPDAGRKSPVDAERLADAFVKFADLKKQRRLIDFDDLLALAARDLHADPAYAEAIAWRFKHLFVDEFQDINPLQAALLTEWVADRDDLCVVGDPDQAIYGWNGADASHLAEFAARPNVRTIELHENFRSAPAVVSIANQMLDPTRELPATNRSAEAEPTLVDHSNDRAEAKAIARAVRDSHTPGSSWSAQAILIRTNAQASLLQDALAAASIPYRVRGGRSFVDHPTVAAAIALLHSLDTTLRKALPDLRDLHVSHSPGHDHREHLEVVVRLAVSHLRINRDLTAAAFAELLGTAAESEVIGPATDAVDIITFHAAKGLEWPVVHLGGLEDGYVPIWQARDRAAVEEERRLLYVAMTRARSRLTMHWAHQRTFGDQPMERTRSPFLRVLDEYQGVVATEPDPSVRASIRTQRQNLDPSEPFHVAHDSLHASVMAWRAKAARGAGVDPAAVLPDRVVDNIARLRPTNPTELAAIEGLSKMRHQRYGEALLKLTTAAGFE